MHWRSTLTLAVASLLFACGGSSEGRGSETLYVDALAYSDGSSDGSWVAVEVRRGHSEGDLLTNARVGIRDGDGDDWDLPWEGVQIGGFRAGVYFRRLPWRPRYTLEVESGDDWLKGTLAAPGLTHITEPTPGSHFDIDGGEPLTVRWDDEDRRAAMEVEIDLKEADFNRVLSEDKGRFEIEVSRLVRDDKEELTIERSTVIDLAGGVAGSRFEGRTVDDIEFAVD